MRKSLFPILLLTLCCTFSCKKAELTDPLPEKTNQNLIYFGYTLIDVGWDDPSDNSSKTNYTDEIADFSNVADILVVTPEDEIVERLEAMDLLSVNAVLHLNELFFELTGSGGDRSGSLYSLRADYQARWDSFVSINDLTTNTHLINSFYLGEEPAWNSIPEADFTAASDYIKQTVPQVPIFLVEAFAVVDEMYVPTSVDWVGFDHYFLQKPSTNDEFLAEYATVKSKMQPHQRMFLIMDAHHIRFAHGSAGISKDDMDFIARDYYQLANADTSVIGILGYYWPNGFEFSSALGTRGLPEHVLEEHKRIGKSITGKP